MEENKPSSVDYQLIVRKILEHKRLYVKTLAIAFIIGCIYTLSIPRFYTTGIKLAPEVDNAGTGGALSSIASSFGFDLSEIQTSDAITPLLYPELMEDNGFVAKMFRIHVISKDGTIDTDYYDYIRHHQKVEWWNLALDWVKRLFKKSDSGTAREFDPYYLSKDDDGVVEKIKNDIRFKADKKTGVITITTTAQDPLICKTLADSVKQYLQDFITDYRTNKARTDYEYYKKLATEAKHEYEKKRQQYASFSDASTHVSLKSIEMKMEDMENELQLKFNAYSTINTQMQAAKAKVQERTPAFTVIKGAAVPIKHAGPKRMLIVALILILTFIGTTVYIMRRIMRPDKAS